MVERRLSEVPHAEPPEPSFEALDEVRAAIGDCRRCPLYQFATQAVFGDGSQQADIMFVGEQPGDQEDLAGKPFVGPAGKVLDAAMEAAGIERSRAYVTNAVKHFKFVPRGKRRCTRSRMPGKSRRAGSGSTWNAGSCGPRLW